MCQFSQYLGTKLGVLFEIVKSVEMVIILEKQLFYHKIVDFMQKHYSVTTFVHINLQKSPFFCTSAYFSIIRSSDYGSLRCVVS